MYVISNKRIMLEMKAALLRVLQITRVGACEILKEPPFSNRLFTNERSLMVVNGSGRISSCYSTK